jgi:enoyl-CoA hydratase/carnithine racemase
MKEFDTIKMNKKGHIGVIIWIESVNALNEALLKELDEAIDQFQDDGEVRTLIITGSCEREFSGGADLREFGISFHKVFNRIERYPKPVIAAINGYASGAGCELAMACHFRLMVDDETASVSPSFTFITFYLFKKDKAKPHFLVPTKEI